MVEFAIVMILKHRFDDSCLQSSAPPPPLGSKTGQSKDVASTISSRPLDEENKTNYPQHRGTADILKKKAWVEDRTTNDSLNDKPIYKRIDKMSFLLFPLLFVMFNVMYWMYYCLI